MLFVIFAFIYGIPYLLIVIALFLLLRKPSKTKKIIGITLLVISIIYIYWLENEAGFDIGIR